MKQRIYHKYHQIIDSKTKEIIQAIVITTTITTIINVIRTIIMITIIDNICARMVILFWSLTVWQYMFESLFNGLLQTFICLFVMILNNLSQTKIVFIK